ncbi:MAG TPA: phosphatidylglycerol lysyltransferase domain-containing protein [Myxococcota bacterium]|nr:phosphatidylglycerol lysyltransferase domain-containing protein [Myxococcota bacterium]
MHDPPSQLSAYLSYLTRKEMGIKTHVGSDLRFLVGWSLESEQALYGPPLPLADSPAVLLEQMKSCHRALEREDERGFHLDGVYVFLLNEEWARSFGAIGARVFPTPDDDNYIYRSADIERMDGRRLKPHRHNVRSFGREFGDLEERELDANRASDAETIIRKWTREKISRLREHAEASPSFYRNLRDDHASATESLRSLAQIPLQGRIYYLNGEPVGYMAGLPLEEDTFLILNQKNLRLRGLSETVFQRFAKSLMHQYAFFNGGSDAGIASLRFRKEHWGPARILRTYGAFLSSALLGSRPGARKKPRSLDAGSPRASATRPDSVGH